MKFEKEYLEDSLVIRPYGRIDSITSNEFKEEVFSVIKERPNIIVDFKETEYISSSGLRVFLSAKKELGENGNISIINCNPSILEVFEMTGFSQMFDISEVKGNSKEDTKIVFVDIDGTILSHSKGRVPDSTERAIKKLQEKGIKVVIASGRDINEINKLPLDHIKFDGYLTLNGNICLDENKKMFAGNEIDPGEVEVLVSIFKAGKIPFVLIGAEKRYINYVDDVVIQTQETTHGTIPDIGQYSGEKIYQCLAFVDAKTRKKLDDLLDNCRITAWHETGIDIIADTGGKGAGIQKFLDKEGLSRAETMAFGDGENDKSMIKFVAIGVAMGNACEELKKEATYITEHIDDDGLAKALVHFGLIDGY